MNESAATPPPPQPVEPPTRRGCLFYGGISALVLALVIAVTAVTTIWWFKRQLNAKPITPTELTVAEQQVLDEKLRSLQEAEESVTPEASATAAEEVPEGPPANKVMEITEKELNAILNHNTDLGDKVYLSLGRDAVSARWNIPVPPDAPMFGGKMLRGQVKVQVQFENDQLKAYVRDVTVGGISLPNAWLGGIKGTDLIAEYSGQDDVLRGFVAGIKDVELGDGRIRVVLAD